MRAQSMALSESVPHMRIAALTAALLAALLATGPAQAQNPTKQPVKSVAAKEAKPDPLALAQTGDAEAQYRLGKAYLTGKGMKGIKRNVAEGLSWLALAAAGGSAEAAADLAQAYETGRGVTKSEFEAARWWLQAGKLGNEAARDRFLDLLMAGAVPGLIAPDAARWLEAKAESGDVKSMLRLGRLYELGQVVPADTGKAVDWYLQAAQAGDAEGHYRLGRLYLELPGAWRVGGSKDRSEAKLFTPKPTPRQARDESVDWNQLDYVRPGMLPAEHWLSAAARRGHAEAQYLLGLSLAQGIDLPFSITKAAGLLQAAAERNHPGALMMLAGMAANGHGLHGKDPVRGWANYDLAAQLGRKDAAAARDALAKTMNQRQIARARFVAQELRDIRGVSAQ